MNTPFLAQEMPGTAVQEEFYPTYPGANIARIGLSHSVEPPAGYSYTDNLTDEQAALLLRDHYPLPVADVIDMQLAMAEHMRDWGSIIHVGLAETTSGRVVGVGMLALFGAERAGLSNFVVHRDHRNRGVGKTILDERIALADQIGVRQLHIPYLEYTNILQDYYRQKGFQRTPDGDLYRNIAE